MVTLSINIDENTFSRFKLGEVSAFDKIYYAYNKKLFGFVFKILKTEADTKEIVQEVLVKVWVNRERITNLTLLDSYLFTIAYNASIDLIRKKITKKRYVDYVKSLQLNYFENKTTDDYNYKELTNQFELLINKLPSRQKEVFRLSRIENLSYKEISKKLNISTNTVENHISKSLHFMRKNINESSLENL